MKKKFNGVIVGHLTNLKGRELGAFMTYCKSLPWIDEILDMNDKEIDEKIMKAYGEWMK